MPERDRVVVAPEHVREAGLHVRKGEALVGALDVVACLQRVAEGDRDEVVPAGARGWRRRLPCSRRSRACRRRGSRAGSGTFLSARGSRSSDRRIPPPSASAPPQQLQARHGACPKSKQSSRTLERVLAELDSSLVSYARLAVRVGVNLQPGQVLAIDCLLEHAPLARTLAREAYAAGARYVDCFFVDHQVRRSHIEEAPAEMLDWSPPWLVRRFQDIGNDGGSAGRDHGQPRARPLREPRRHPPRRRPHAGARPGQPRPHRRPLQLDGDRRSERGLGADRLRRARHGPPWQAVAAAVRLDEPDPVAAWQTHMGHLRARAERLNERRFGALRFLGPGTDLRVGLHPDSSWLAAIDVANGIEYLPNMPTEEVFTCPDARRVDGVVTATYPFELHGMLVEGLRIRFVDGRATEIDASVGADLVRAHAATDDGAGRLGEVALVDRHSRVGRTGLVFYNTLFDENAASHIALGSAVRQANPRGSSLGPEERHAAGINDSLVHTDFMIGSSAVAVSGLADHGEEVPILLDGDWVL